MVRRQCERESPEGEEGEEGDAGRVAATPPAGEALEQQLEACLLQMRAEVLDSVSRIGGRLGELRLDTELDIACARAAGARVVAVATGGRSYDELAEHRPDLVLRDLTDGDVLWDWVARNVPS